MLNFLGSTLKVIGGPLGVVVIAFILWVLFEWPRMLAELRRNLWAWLVLLLAFVIMGGVRFVYVPSLRYQSPLLIPLILLTGGGVMMLIAILRRWLPATAGIVVVVIGGLLVFALYLQQPDNSKGYLRAFAETLRLENKGARKPSILFNINSRGRNLLYYAGMPESRVKFYNYPMPQLNENGRRRQLLDELCRSQGEYDETYVLLAFERASENWFQQDVMTLWGYFPFETLGRHDDKRKCTVLYRYRPEKSEGEPLALILPDRLRLLERPEYALFFDNMILAPEGSNHIFRVESRCGTTGKEAWHFKPTRPESFSWKLQVSNARNELLAAGGMDIEVLAPATGSAQPLSLLLLGGLSAEKMFIPEALQKIIQEAGLPVTLAGGHSGNGRPEIPRHEGHDTWSWQRYVSEYRPQPEYRDGKLYGSPFLFPGKDGKPAIDVERYLKRIEFSGKLDSVIAIWDSKANQSVLNVPATLNSECEAFDRLLAAFKNYNPRIKVGIVPPLPPAGSQDAFRIYGNHLRWDYQMSQHLELRMLMERYGHREQENIFLLPGYLFIDPANDFVRYESRQNPILLNREGGRKVAEVLAGWVNWLLVENKAGKERHD